MEPPSREQINVHGSLDDQTAGENFFGKSVEQAEMLFIENSLYYQGDSLWMGPVAFCYYVKAAIRYIESEKAIGDSDMISCFAGILEIRLRREATQLTPIAKLLVSVCDYIVERYDSFEVTPEIYGDVRSRFGSLGHVFSKLAIPPKRS